jgi:phage/plasmid-associated DNA primase
MDLIIKGVGATQMHHDQNPLAQVSGSVGQSLSKTSPSQGMVFGDFPSQLTERSPESFAHFYGAAGCGKSTLTEAAYRALGDVTDNGYAITLKAKVLVDKGNNGEGPSPLLNECRHARLVVIDEAAKVPVSPDLLKSLTSGAFMNTRGLHESGSRWQSNFTLVTCGNDRLHLSESDSGITRRLLPVFFKDSPTPNPAIKQVLSSQAGLNVVLSVLIKAAVRWYENKLTPVGELAPAVIQTARREYLSGDDQFTDWLDERCTILTEEEPSALDMRPAPSPQQLLNDYRSHTGNRKLGLPNFVAILKERGHPVTEKKLRDAHDQSLMRRVPSLRLLHSIN